MLSLVAIVLVVSVVLSLLLAAWTMFFQGYIYSEPVPAIYWRAPAAGGALTFFILIWIVLDYNSIKRPTDEGRYRTLFEFNTYDTEVYEQIIVPVEQRRKEIYKRQDNEYKSKGKRLPSRPPQMIAVDKDGHEHVFKPKTDAKGHYQTEKDGSLRYYEEGNDKRYMTDAFPGKVSTFRFGILAMTLLLNSGFLIVWFVAMWLLLRFQWSHALGLAIVAWLISLFILPMILTYAEKVCKARLPPAATASVSHRTPIL